MPISGLSRVYLLQTYLPTKELGKGFSFNAFLLYLSNAISLGLFGVLSSFLPIRILFIICGFMMAICAAIYLRILARKVLGVIPYNRLNN
ncbi:hypothetical protein J32TS6_16770 [Virgibacillus pantothenticus]|nr:hypothetical protein J32TS6_16770 [Virgibacillus pantothenticus]